jgi:hypothetical protein
VKEPLQPAVMVPTTKSAIVLARSVLKHFMRSPFSWPSRQLPHITEAARMCPECERPSVKC